MNSKASKASKFFCYPVFNKVIFISYYVVQNRNVLQARCWFYVEIDAHRLSSNDRLTCHSPTDNESYFGKGDKYITLLTLQ